MQKSPLRVTIEHQGTAFSITRTKSKRVGKLIISSRSNTFSERYGMGVWWESQRAAQTCYPEALMETYHVIGGAGSLRSSMSSIMKRGWTFRDIKISWNSDDFQRVGSLVIFCFGWVFVNLRWAQWAREILKKRLALILALKYASCNPSI